MGAHVVAAARTGADGGGGGGGVRSVTAVVRLLLVALVILGGTAACGRGSAKDKVSAGKLGELAAERGTQSRRFEWSSTIAKRTVSVSGLVEDDYRYQGTVSINNEPVWQEVVVDDTRYLKVVDPAAILEPELITEMATAGPAGAALMGGQWVRDIRGAPGEFTPRTQQIPLDSQLVLSAARRLDRVAEVLRLGGFTEYNTFAVSYLPKNDKFPKHEEDGIRFDHVPAAFDPNKLFTKLDDARAYVEFASFWATLEGVNRLERLMELPKPSERYHELYDQLIRAGDRRLVVLLEAIKANPDDEDLRRLTETYTVAPDPDATVTVPAEAVDGDLIALLGILRERIGSRPDPGPLFGPLE